MKLPELKKIFRKKYVIRFIAGALVVGLVSTGTVTYTAKADRAAETQQAAESIIDSDYIKVSSKDIDKDESVYLIAGADGTVTDTIVAAHLINRDKADTIEDVSDLTDITNTTGDETFTQSGDKLTWQAGGSDIYYQGHTTKQAPVSVKVTYTLDGKEVTPSELAGKSGHVKIHYDYTNNTSTTQKVNGKDVSTVVPFAAITGMILNDSFSDVSVTNGRVIANGTKSIVLGYALPGIKDALEKDGGSFDSDVSLPETFEVEADVTDFSLETQMTAIVDASNTLTSDSQQTADLSSDIDDLQDASKQLKDGSKQLSDGAGELESGAKSAADGSQELLSGTSRLRSGLSTLQGSMPAFTSGAADLSTGLKTYTAGVSQLNGGLGQLRSALAPLSSVLPSLDTRGITDLASQMQALSKGVAALKSGSDQLQAGYTGDGTAANPGLVSSMDQLKSGSGQVSQAASEVASGASSLDKGISQIQSMLSGASSQFEAQSKVQLTQTIDISLNGNDSLIGLLRQMGILGANETINLSNIDTVTTNLTAAQSNVIAALSASSRMDAATATATYYKALDGLHQVQAAKTALDSASKALESQLTSESVTSQLKQLTDGSKQLADGSGKLAQGAKSLSDGISAANDGVKKLSDGQKQLSAGIDQLYTSLGASSLGKIDISSVSDLSGQFTALIKAVEQLYTGSSTLVANNDKLTSGAASLSTGASQISGGIGALYTGAGSLYTGQKSLSDGLTTLYQGTTELSDGASELYDGFVKFDEEGIEKLVNSYNGEIRPLADQIRAAIQAGEDYQSFSGLASGKQGSVKFLYRMDSISAPDTEE